MPLDHVKQRVRVIRDNILLTTRPGTRQLIKYLLVLLVLYLIILPFKAVNGNVAITYYILDGIHVFGTSAFPSYTIAEIIAFGPIMSLVMVGCFRNTIASWVKVGMMSKRKARVLEVLLILSIALLNSGIMINRLFNIASAQAKAFYDATSLGAGNYIFAYYLDELVGHHLMNAGMVLYYALMAIAMPRDSSCFAKTEFAMNGGERVLVLVSSAIYAVVFSIENLEGQSAVFSIALMGALTGIIIIATMARKNKLSAWNRPFLMFLTIEIITMLVFVLVWGLVLGIKPYYPFFYEPSEIGGML
jgi:hypothetical protein